MTLLLRRSTSSLRSRLLLMLNHQAQENLQYSLANPTNAEHHQLVNELIELMYRFNESFQYSTKHGPSHGILYKNNELYFSRNATRLPLAGDDPSALDNVKEKILANLNGPVLLSALFPACTSSRLSVLLKSLRIVYIRRSNAAFVWRDSEFSASLTGK